MPGIADAIAHYEQRCDARRHAEQHERLPEPARRYSAAFDVAFSLDSSTEDRARALLQMESVVVGRARRQGGLSPFGALVADTLHERLWRAP